MTALSKQLSEFQSKAATRKDLNEAKTKMAALTSRSQEFSDINVKVTQLHTDLSQALLDVRADLSKRMNEIQKHLGD